MSYEKYYLSSEKIKDLATTALIVFDTSALLSIYGLSPNARNDIFDNVLEGIKERLWIPDRVNFEFHKNRLTVSEKPIKQYNNLLINEGNSDGGYVKKILSCIQSEISQGVQSLKGQYNALKEVCTDNQRHPIIDPNEFADFDKAIESFSNALSEFEANASSFQNHLKGVVENAIQAIKEQLKTDTVPEKISGLFKVGDEFSFEQLWSIAKEGQKRYSMQIPPGYEDAKNKQGMAVYGDLILWKQLLLYATEMQASVLFVSNDMKPDWMDKDHGEAPRVELLQEFNSATNGQYFWIVNFSYFLHLLRDINLKQRDITVEDATLQEVDNAIVSNVGAYEVFNYKDSIAESGYKIISEKDFLIKLETILPYFLNDNKFLSSKYFVETILANDGYDIRSSWEVFNFLKTQGKIIEYKHDPKNGFPALSVVCFPKFDEN